jgi:hypothetical protein
MSVEQEGSRVKEEEINYELLASAYNAVFLLRQFRKEEIQFDIFQERFKKPSRVASQWLMHVDNMLKVGISDIIGENQIPPGTEVSYGDGILKVSRRLEKDVVVVKCEPLDIKCSQRTILRLEHLPISDTTWNESLPGKRGEPRRVMELRIDDDSRKEEITYEVWYEFALFRGGNFDHYETVSEIFKGEPLKY